MNIWPEDLLSLIDLRRKDGHINPETFEYNGPTDEEKTWFKVTLDGPERGNIYENAAWLHKSTIADTDWYWVDRAVNRMVWRTNIFFKNEKDAIMFLLWRG